MAQYQLGKIYFEGTGVDINQTRSFEWFLHSALQENKKAQYRLGLMYVNGFGVQQNFESAAEWFQKAGESGFTPAQYQLALLYAKGKGVPHDILQAYAWCYAASRSDQVSVLKTLKQIADQLDRLRLAEAGRLGEEYYKKFNTGPEEDVLLNAAESD